MAKDEKVEGMPSVKELEVLKAKEAAAYEEFKKAAGTK